MSEPNIRVFLSYSHDSPEHQGRVYALSERLLQDGIDAHLDLHEPFPSQGWPNWMLDQIEQARWVLVICTETYHRRVRGDEKAGKGAGAAWEGAIITQGIYENKGKNFKFIPVIFSSEDRDSIPIFLRSYTHYLISDEYDKLYRHLMGIPLFHKSPIGKPRDLKPLVVQPLQTGFDGEVSQEKKSSPSLEGNKAKPLVVTSPPREGQNHVPGSGRSGQMREHAFRSLVSSLSEAGNFERLFDLIENRAFLADQARHLGGFEHGSRDLESFAIPAAIQKGDWARFFHYSTLALNLRGIAEMLTHPEILRSLSRGDHIAWAASFAGLLADPLDRAEALATIIEIHDARDPRRSSFIEHLRDELENVPLMNRGADIEHRTEALCKIGRKLGPELYGTWGKWINELGLGPKEARRVRRAVAESWIDRGDLQTPKFWERLRAMDDPPALLEIVRDRLRSDQVALPGDALARLEPLFQGRGDLFLRARALLLGRQAREAPTRASLLLQIWIEERETPWAVELLEDAAELLFYASPPDLDRLAEKLPTPLLRAALRVVALEALPNAARAAEALQEIEAISDSAAKLHWVLRYLAAHPRVPSDSYQQQVWVVRDYLRTVSYSAGPEDLCRFLDLLAEVLPSKLERELEALLLEPSSSFETAFTVADRTNHVAVAELLLKISERVAAKGAATEAESFQIRNRLITQTVCRLCVLTGDLGFLKRGAESLSHEEEDELRSLLSSQLAELERNDPRQHRLAFFVCDGIQDPRLRLLTTLKIAPPEKLSHTLEPASLYRVMSDVTKLEDEILGLSLLQSAPLDPLSQANRSLPLFKEPSHSARAVLRLAWHTLRSPANGQAGLDLADSYLRAGDDQASASLIPDLVEFVVHASDADSIAEEFQEAVHRTTAMPLSWEDRLEVFEGLLSTLRRVFLGETALLDADRASPVLRTFLRLPLDLKPKPSRIELRGHWSKFLPMITATLELFPQSIRASCLQHLEASVFALSPKQDWLAEICCAVLAERLDLAWPVLEAAAPDPDKVTALVYLLASPAPEMIVRLLARCLEAEDRSRLCLRLIRHGWVSREVNLGLRKFLTTRMDRFQADVWTFPRNLTEAEDWLRSLGDLLGDLDISDPHTEPLIRELWNCPINSGHPVLATAVVEVLKTRGRSRAESALRFWLHSFLAPSLGSGSAHGQMRLSELKWILRKAMSLPAT